MPVSPNLESLVNGDAVYVRQQRELAELFGFESRNKYGLYDEHRTQLGFAAEQQKGVIGFLLRQVLGHWRTFEITFFDTARQTMFIARHPFRFFFQRLEVLLPDGTLIGALQQRFGIFSKKFDVVGPNGDVLMEMRSGLLSFWTFPFKKGEREVGVIEKKWSGTLTEIFTDKDNFRVRFSPGLTSTEKLLMLAATVFVDLQYFEAKAERSSLLQSSVD
jgi:uncharacterized protein YxjI